MRVRHGALGLPVPQRRRQRTGLGGLFEYKLKVKVTLKKNQSALVPIAQTGIEAEKVSLWTGTCGSGRPSRGLWLKNTSPLTLDGGSFSVLEVAQKIEDTEARRDQANEELEKMIAELQMEAKLWRR